MLIPCREIAQIIEKELRIKIQELYNSSIHNKRIILVAYLLGQSDEQLSFVAIKQRLAQRLGIGFDFTHYPHVPPVNQFVDELKTKMEKPENTGVIIQHPLPNGYEQETLYRVVPSKKEIEGHKPDSPFHFPLSLAVLTGIKYVFGYAQQNKELDTNILVNFDADKEFFRKVLKDKKIIIVGRGSTGGKPIAECMDEIGIPYTGIHSKTINPETEYEHADLIITATGNNILKSHMLKSGVILLNVGLRKENGKLKGDYNEDEIKDIAAYYTETPGGLGPLDVLYLYKNLIDAAQ